MFFKKKNEDRINLVDLFKPNAQCNDLMYTPSGDVSDNIALEKKSTSIYPDESEFDRFHSTINQREDIIPPNTLIPSITGLFRKQTLNRFQTEYDPDIDGTAIPHFAKPGVTNPFEVCIIRGILSCVMGYGGGCLFAMFINAFQNPVPFELQDTMSTKEQVIYGYKDMVKQMKRMGKQMAIIGGLYGFIQCVVEKKRAKQDIENHLYTGCLTGGILGASGGPWAACMGCGGFAAFSWVIEHYMDAADEPERQDDENERNYQNMLTDDLNWM